MTDMPIAQVPVRETVIRPTAGWRALNLAEAWHYRDVALTLAVRDVKLRYRQTALGAIWVVLQPLLGAGIFSFVFGSVAGLHSNGVPYVVFSYAGLLGWNVFNNVVGKASTSLVLNALMLRKVFFPRILLPVSTVFGGLIDFAVALAMMVVLMVVYGVPARWANATLPLWLLLAVVLSLGIGIMAAGVMVSYRDVQQIIPVALNLLLYISPVAYATAAVPASAHFLFDLNPLVGLLDGFRWALLPHNSLNVGATVYSAGAALVLLVIGAVSFARTELRFADVI